MEDKFLRIREAQDANVEPAGILSRISNQQYLYLDFGDQSSLSPI